jgi:exodeoxyribonuclease-1
MRFDETLLRQAYYQTLLPVYQTNTNGNGRADMMRIAQVVSACAPNILAVPLQADGKASFKLGLVASANGVALEIAHEALSDTNATLGVARLIKQRASSLWDVFIGNARKGGPLRLLRSEPVLLLSENFFGSSYNFIVTPITTNVNNANEWGVFDLHFDPMPYLDASDDDLRAAIDGKVKTIRRVSINSQPGLLPITFMPEDVRGGRQSMETYRTRARLVSEHSFFRKRVGSFLAERYADQPESTHVEERIYSGFPSNDDQSRMNEFHKSGWDKRASIIKEIEDDRYRALGQRILATEQPEQMTANQRRQWESWRRDRLLTEDDMPWLTVARALEEIADLSKNAQPDRRQQITEIERFLKSLGN